MREHLKSNITFHLIVQFILNLNKLRYYYILKIKPTPLQIA